MTPADVNAYYNSPNNYIGSLSLNSNSSSLAFKLILANTIIISCDVFLFHNVAYLNSLSIGNSTATIL